MSKNKSKQPKIIYADSYEDAIDKSLELMNIDELGDLMSSIGNSNMIETINQAVETVDSMDLNGMTGLDVANFEIDAYGIDKANPSYKILAFIINHINKDTFNKRPELQELYDISAKEFKTTAANVKKDITALFKNARYENSKFIPILKSLDKSQITPDLILINLTDYLY